MRKEGRSSLRKESRSSLSEEAIIVMTSFVAAMPWQNTSAMPISKDVIVKGGVERVKVRVRVRARVKVGVKV